MHCGVDRWMGTLESLSGVCRSPMAPRPSRRKTGPSRPPSTLRVGRFPARGRLDAAVGRGRLSAGVRLGVAGRATAPGGPSNSPSPQ